MTGHDRLLAVVATVQLVLCAGGTPSQVEIHPDDFAALRDDAGRPLPVTTASVLGLPLILSWDCPLGQVLVVE